jgi:hypothetical protein
VAAAALATVVALAAVAVPEARASTTPASGCGVEWTDTWVQIPQDQQFVNCNGYKLIFQNDGNLVIYKPDGTPSWSSGVLFPAPGKLVYQGNYDGNLVILDSHNNVKWASNVSAPHGRLRFAEDNNLEVFASGGRPAWWSNKKDCAGYTWSNTWKVFHPGETYVGCTGDMYTFTTGGDLAYVDPEGTQLWDTGTTAAGGTVVYQGSYDGNLIVYNAANQPVWATDTAAPNGSLRFTSGGALSVENQQGQPEWVELEKDRQALIKDGEEALRIWQTKCTLGTDPQWTPARCAWAIPQATEFLQALRNFKPNEPCTSWQEIVILLSHVASVAIEATEWLLTDGLDEVDFLKAVTGAMAALSDGYEMSHKCETWNILRNVLRHYHEEHPDRKIGLMPTLAPDGSHIALVNFAEAGMPDGQAAAVAGDFAVDSADGFSQWVWHVDYGLDPQTQANTIVGSPIETTRNGVPGTLFTMGNGDTIFMPQGPVDYSELIERDNSTGHATTTIYDSSGNYVITIDNDRGLVNVNDGWGGNNPFDASRSQPIWGWGVTGFGGWTGYTGGGGGGGGGGGFGGCDLCKLIE